MTNITKAAQQALEALEEIALAGMSGSGQESEEGMRDWHARQAWKFIGIAARALDPLKSALTQRPTAQPTPDAIREHLECIARRACTDEQFKAFEWVIDTTFESLDLLPAPQQATQALQSVCRYISDVLAGDASSGEKHIARTIMHLLPLEQAVAAQQATPERCKSCDDTGHVHDQIGEWRGVRNCPAGDAIRAKAAPEPVGEPVARVELMQTGGNAGLATRIVEIDDPLRERLRPGDSLFARPAPGVPEMSSIAIRKLGGLQERGWQINGYAIRRGNERGFIDSSGFVGWWRGEHDTVAPDAVAMFDAAVEQELPLVSHVEYDSHEICKHFAVNVRKAIAAAQPAPVVPDGFALVPVSLLIEAEESVDDYLSGIGSGSYDRRVRENLQAAIAASRQNGGSAG